MNKTVLVKGIEVVGVLFAAFGGFLVGIAPPQAADARFAVGISSFFALIILLLISSLARKKYRKAWITVAICCLILAIVASYYYKVSYNELTFEFPPGNPKVEYVAGTELTPLAQKERRDDPGISNAKLLAGFGGPRFIFKVWPEASLNAARKKLIFAYVILVTALASSIFSLTEGTLGNTGTESGRQNRSKQKRNKRLQPLENTKPHSLKATTKVVSKPGSKRGTIDAATATEVQGENSVRADLSNSP